MPVRLEGILDGLSGGYLLVEIDTEDSRLEGLYPQSNNSAVVPLP